MADAASARKAPKVTPPQKARKVTAARKSAKVESIATKSEVTRQRIVDAAAKVFAEKGYAHTRLSDIAREAQSHAGGIYYYFASREDLVEEVLKISTGRTVNAINARLNMLPEHATAAEKITSAVTGQVEEILSGNYYTKAFLKMYSQVPNPMKDRHRPVLREFFDIWRNIIRSGQATGEIRTDIDAAVMRLAIIGSIQWSVEWVEPGTSTAEVLGAKMAKLFISGVMASHA